MRLPDDDELYEVDQTYLGPPGRYVAAMRHKAIFAWLVLGPLTFVVARRLGMPFTFFTVGLLLIAVTWSAMAIADRATTERPLTSWAAAVWSDVRAPRPGRENSTVVAGTLAAVRRRSTRLSRTGPARSARWARLSRHRAGGESS